MAAKPKRRSSKRTSKKTKAARRQAPTEERTRLDRVVGAQQRAVNRFSEFAEDVADMTMRGTYTPSKWVSAYGTMWRNLAKDMADLTKRLLED